MFAGKTLLPMLPASDIDRARSFYADKLGFEPADDADGVLRYESGGSSFIVYSSEYAGTNQATGAMWEVDDLDAVVAMLKSRDVEFQEFAFDGMEMSNSVLTSPTGTKAAWLYDSERNILGLVEQAA